MPKVSVIVPIYNVEKYIERCLRSLFEQTLDDIEYIFVNDCTLDNSMIILEKVLKEYPHRIKQVKIINHEQNQGQAGARTSGMKAMTGEYMIHCDPDDWVELNMYNEMYTRAKETFADIVVSDLYEEYANKQIYVSLYSEKSSQEIIMSDEALNTRWYLPCRLIKTDIITQHSIYPIEGINILEDMTILFKIYFYSSLIEYLQYPYYHYNKSNDSSITNSTRSNPIVIRQQILAIKYIEKFLTKNGIRNNNFIYYWKILLKDRFLNLNPALYTEWKETFPEISRHVKAAKNDSVIYRNLYYFAHKYYVVLILFRFYHFLSSLK